MGFSTWEREAVVMQERARGRARGQHDQMYKSLFEPDWIGFNQLYVRNTAQVVLCVAFHSRARTNLTYSVYGDFVSCSAYMQRIYTDKISRLVARLGNRKLACAWGMDSGF